MVWEANPDSFSLGILNFCPIKTTLLPLLNVFNFDLSARFKNINDLEKFTHNKKLDILVIIVIMSIKGG